MKKTAYRVGLTALGALIVLVVDELIGKLFFPGVSVISVHAISVVVVAALALLLLRYASTPGDETFLDAKGQPDISQDAHRLLPPLLGTMREAILIVDARLEIVLYNDAAANILR